MKKISKLSMLVLLSFGLVACEKRNISSTSDEEPISNQTSSTSSSLDSSSLSISTGGGLVLHLQAKNLLQSI